jgi:hypothetical protein
MQVVLPRRRRTRFARSAETAQRRPIPRIPDPPRYPPSCGGSGSSVRRNRGRSALSSRTGKTWNHQLICWASALYRTSRCYGKAKATPFNAQSSACCKSGPKDAALGCIRLGSRRISYTQGGYAAAPWGGTRGETKRCCAGLAADSISPTPCALPDKATRAVAGLLRHPNPA